MIDKLIPYKLTPDELIFLRDASRFAEANDLISRLSREQRKLLAEALQDAIIRQGNHALYSTITLEVHVIDEEAMKKQQADARPAAPPYVTKCVYCHQPVEQCTCVLGYGILGANPKY